MVGCSGNDKGNTWYVSVNNVKISGVTPRDDITSDEIWHEEEEDLWLQSVIKTLYCCSYTSSSSVSSGVLLLLLVLSFSFVRCIVALTRPLLQFCQMYCCSYTSSSSVLSGVLLLLHVLSFSFEVNVFATKHLYTRCHICLLFNMFKP